jgi:hypothetical protein
VRDDILRRWVDQPPTTPIVQHLRDAERRAALAQVGRREHVLDVASEATVTAGIDAERVTRVDFGADADAHAREVLGDAVDRYEQVDPDDPALPFADDAFDAAVSVGPYDWKFLDVEALTDELHRVVADRLVVTVPTPRSPYARRGHNRFRYLDPADALALLAPDWRLVERDLLFQYPGRVHHLVSDLPAPAQHPFVALADRLSTELTARGRWDDASYLVLGVEPLPLRAALSDALDCLFRSTDAAGFWHDDEGRIVRALTRRGAGRRRVGDGSVGDGGVGSGSVGPTSESADPSGEAPDRTDDALDPAALSFDWYPDDEVEWRYVPFALCGATTWRTSALGTDAYDRKLRRALGDVTDRLADETTREGLPSYGVGPLIDALARAGDLFDERYRELAWTLFRESAATADFDHAEDALLPFGWVTLLETAHADEPTDEVRAAVEDALWRLTDRISPEGLFAFDNPTTRRHQNQMYALWGLCRAVRATDRPAYLDSVERVLDHAIAERMRPDGAFLWEDVPAHRRRGRDLLRRLGFDVPHWDLLFPCHQAFFVTAVAEYHAAGGERSYDRAVGEAMGWVFGDNALGADLVAASGIGVPLRVLTTRGEVEVPRQQFVGSYEVGAWLLALTRLLDGPF